MSKRVISSVAVLLAMLGFGFGPATARGQEVSQASRPNLKAINVVPSSFHVPGPASLRPLTPAEKAIATARNTQNVHPMLSSLPTSNTQIFTAAITTQSGGQQTIAAATGDLNGDGKLDLVMASQCAPNNCSNGVITVLLGNGDGTYQAPVSYSTATDLQAVTLADVNGDGLLDIVAVSYCNSSCSSGVVNVMLGNGDGTFQPAVAYNTGAPTAKAVAVGDTNGDGKLDLLVVQECNSTNSCSNGVLSVLLGNGDGTFQSAVNYSSGAATAQGIAVADLNGDGKLDVAIVNECVSNSNCSNGIVSVLLGNGDGTFQNAINSSSAGIESTAIVIGDVNGDGHPDVLVSNSCENTSNCSYGTVGVLLGNGDGTLQNAVQYGSGGTYAQSLALADLNRDGKLDVVVSNQCPMNSNCQSGNAASVLLGNGDGTFQSGIAYAAGSNDFMAMMGPSLTTVLVGDVNGDGNPDVLVTDSCYGTSFICNTGSINVLLGYGDGTLQAGVIYPTGSWNSYGMAVADVNGDGKPDLLIANECGDTTCTGGSVSVLLSNGDGTFQAPVTYSSGGEYAYWIAAADVNGDGKADIVVTNQCTTSSNCSQGVVGVLLGNGDGTFQAPTTYSTNNNGETVVLADVNGDNKLDIVLAAQCGDSNCTAGAVNVMLGNGDGTFQSAVSYNSGGTYALGVAVGDTNGDGKPDIVVANECQSNSSCSNGIVSVLLGNGDGTFQPAVNYNSGGQSAEALQAADVNGDGKLDIVVENSCASNNCSNSAMSVLLGNGDGTFQTALTTLVPQSEGWQTIVVGDFNGDHKLDVASGASDVLLLGNGDGTFQSPMSLGAIGIATVSADFNGDGRPDLAVGGVTVLLNISDGFIVPTTTGVSSSANPSTFGQSITLNATVAPQTQGAPTGTITFSDGAVQLGQATLLQGTATLSTSSLAIGSHSITASYSGDSHYAASTSSALTQVVQNGATTTALTATPNPANVGQNVILTASVNAASSGVPTGTISFLDGSTQIGSSSLANGVATFSISSLAAGSHHITAVYGGSNDYSGSTSSVLSESVTVAGFALSSKALSSTTIQPGGSAQWTITINPAGGFNPSMVDLSCAVTPLVSSPVSCSVTPVSVSGGVGTATLHVSSKSSQADLRHIAKGESGTGKLGFLAFLIPCLCLGGTGMSQPNRRKLLAIGIAILIAAGCMLQTACGGYSTPATTTNGTPGGTYTVTVTGTSGAMHQATSVVVKVQ